jgi:hypothetical protein
VLLSEEVVTSEAFLTGIYATTEANIIDFVDTSEAPKVLNILEDFHTN